MAEDATARQKVARFKKIENTTFFVYQLHKTPKILQNPNVAGTQSAGQNLPIMPS